MSTSYLSPVPELRDLRRVGNHAPKPVLVATCRRKSRRLSLAEKTHSIMYVQRTTAT